jgi:hypothetical protein
MWFGRIFIMPHTLVGIGATGYWLFLWLWAFFGTDLKGHVTNMHTSRTSKGRTVYNVKYSYEMAGQTKTASQGVSRTYYEYLQGLDQESPEITIRHLAIWPYHHDEIRTGTGGLWGQIGFLTLWVGFWDSIMSVFLYQLWIKPLRTRQLYKRGQSTTGTLTRKRAQRGRGTRYFLSYTYRIFDGSLLTSETEIWSSADWDAAKVGQQVTVLYAEAKPKRSTVYEYGGYTVET